MMLIGTSLGGCLQSILAGEVSEDDVLCIISRTAAKDLDGIMHVVEGYWGSGNSYATKPDNYSKLHEFPLDDAKDLAWRLYEAGKIHQPRLYNHDVGFIHHELSRYTLWLEVAPSPNDTPVVVNAYKQYKMLVELTKDEHEHQR